MPTDIAPDTTHSEEDGQTHCSLLFRPTRAYEAFERGASVGPQAKRDLRVPGKMGGRPNRGYSQVGQQRSH